MGGAFSKHRFQIWSTQQHPYKHSVEEFGYANTAIPGVGNVKEALDYVLAVLYPLSQATVPTKLDLPESATFVATPGSPTVITTTGDTYYTDDQVYLASTGTLPTGLSISTVYYLLETAPNTFELYLDKARTVAATSSDAGTGVHSVVNLPNSYRVVLDDGDGKAAAYRWQQLEGELAASWHKVGDLDWGQDEVLAAFQNITQELYVNKLGKDDYDEAGSPLVGDIAGQHVYGGASANTNLILHANAGDGTGPQTGYIVMGDSVVPLSVGLSLGSITKNFQDLWLSSQANIDTMTIQSGSITDSTGDISFGDENLTTTGSVTAESADVNSATIGNMTLQNSGITSTDPAIDFGSNNLTTTGSVTAASLIATGGVESMTIGEASIGSSTAAIDFNANDLNNVADISATSVDAGSITVDDLTLDNNEVSSSSDVNISPALGSKVLLNKSTDVTGDLDVTGNITGDTLSDGKTTLNGTNISSTDGFVDVDSLKVLRAGDAEFVDVKATTLTSPTSASENIEDIVAFPFTGATEGDTLYYNSGAWVAQAPAPSGVTDHGALTGLGDDDHTQYAALAGRSGGQELVGGALATETLTLKANAAGAKEILTKDTVAPFTAANFSGGWQGSDLGTSVLPFRDIHTKGELKGARVEQVGTLPAANVNNKGRLVYLTTDNTIYVDFGGTWQAVGAGTSSPLTTKGDLYTYSTVNTRLPVGTSGQVLSANSLETTGLKWINPASGPFNFILNSDAEVDTTGWATYADADQASPVDGTGGSPTVTFTRTTVTPLSGAGSFLFTKLAGSSSRGQGASYDFTVDPAYRARVINIQFDYIVASGTFAAGTSTTDSDLTVWIYDITNSTLIQPSSFRLLSNSQTIADKFQASFQTSATGSQYRLIFHVATVSTSGYTIEFDNIQVTPTEYAFGTPVTDWQSFTPTGSLTTNTTYTGKYRRIGDSAEIVWQLSFSGDPGTYSTVTVNLPSGMTIDTNKILSTTLYELGDGFSRRAGDLWNAKLLYSSTTALSVFSMRSRTASTSGVDLANTSDTFPAADFVNGDYAYYKAIIPILGWSSSVQTSDQTSTRVVAFDVNELTFSATGGGTATQVTGLTASVDTTGGFSSNSYTISTPGTYRISATAYTGAGTSTKYLQVRKNNVTILTVDGATNAYTIINGNKIFNLVAGDAITLFYYNGAATENWGLRSFSIQRISGPNQIAASETVSALYTGAPPTGTLGAAFNIVTFGTKTKDSHGAYSSGSYTVPVSGQYDISAQVGITHASIPGINNAFIIGIYIDGVSKYWGYLRAASTTVVSYYPFVEAKSIPLKAGQIVTIRTYTDGTTPSYITTEEVNRFTINKSGNY